MFPVFVFFAFLGINVFERGLMDYHDRRIARERKKIVDEHSKHEYAWLSDNDDSSDDDSNPNSKGPAEQPLMKPSICQKHIPRKIRRKVHFGPIRSSDSTYGKSVYASDYYGSRPYHLRDSGRAGSPNGAHWDSFIADWADPEPMVDPWGVVPPPERENSTSLDHQPHVRASRNQGSKPW